MPREGDRAPNHLVDCASPYLQEHAYNPVEWYPWGEEALRRAREEDKPILLSIGYSACHWCHVMRRESFEDPDIAAVMNEHFINIKVDREERPDLDDLYMRAVQLLTGSGGWPLTVFLTPELEPFYGGTYFPPTDRGRMPAFPRVLEAVAESYRERPEEVAESAAQVVEAIEGSSRPPAAEGELSGKLLEGAMREFSASYDMEHGGFGEAPKFPQMPVLEFLLRFWSGTGDERARLMVRTTLRQMAAGGVFDQLGGGFHRYSTDRRWLVPHFEKMLYDNAVAVGLYADASVAFGEEGFLGVSRRCADYMRRVLGSPEGAFYSSQDADSEGEEGKYYAWTYEEIIECLGQEDGQAAARWFGASEEGNWEEGKNALYRALTPGQLAELRETEPAEAEELLARWRQKLLARRSERPAPHVDRKVLTDWNALAVVGLLRLHRAGRDPAHLDEALRCLRFLLEEAVKGVQVAHVWREGAASVPGFLSDYALLCEALLAAYQATFEADYLRGARELAGFMVQDFWEEETGLFREAGGRAEHLLAPVRSVSDQPVPSGASVACHALLQIAELAGEPAETERVCGFLRNCLGLMERSPQGVAHLLSAALRYLSEARELVIVGLGTPAAERLLEVADGFYLPHLVRAGASAEEADELAPAMPLLEGRDLQHAEATAYLCSGGACREPVGEPDRLRQQLEALAPG